jgi:hypothetical protein
MNKKEGYYKSKKSEYFTQFYGFCERIGVLVEEKYGKEFKKEIILEIKEEYECIYGEMPYMGGR